MEPSEAYSKADEILSNEKIKKNLEAGFYQEEFESRDDLSRYIRGMLARIAMDISEFHDLAKNERVAMQDRREKLVGICEAACELSKQLNNCQYEGMWNIGIRDINYRDGRDYTSVRPSQLISLAYQVDLAEDNKDAIEKYKQYSGTIRLSDFLEGLAKHAAILSRQVHPYAPPEQSKTGYSGYATRAIYRNLRHEIPKNLHQAAKINETTKLIGKYFDVAISDNTLKKIKKNG